MAVLYMSLAAMDQEKPKEIIIAEKRRIILRITLNELPIYYAWLVDRLNKQPPFDGVSAVAKNCKILPLDDWYDCKICELLNENVRKVLGEKNSLHVYSIFRGAATASGQFIKTGIASNIYDDKKICDLEHLKSSYEKIIKELKIGWALSTLATHPNVMFKKPEDDWYLFVKKRSLSSEDDLIRFLVHKFELEDHVTCDNGWLNPSGGFENRNEMYMWVKKKEFEKFNAIFGLQMSSHL